MMFMGLFYYAEYVFMSANNGIHAITMELIS